MSSNKATYGCFTVCVCAIVNLCWSNGSDPSSVFSQSSVDISRVQNLVKSTVSPPLQPVVEEPAIAVGSSVLDTSSVDSASNAQSQMNRNTLRPLVEHPQPVSNARHPSSVIFQVILRQHMDALLCVFVL